MTRARVTAQQLTRPPKSARLMRGVVSAVSPLTVQIAGGGAVKGLGLPGQVYTVGDAVLVAVQEPAVGAVYPLNPTPPADLTPYATTAGVAAAYLPKTALSALPTITNLDTAPDGSAFAAAANNPIGTGVLVETMTASLNGTPWRMQRITSETSGAIRSRASYAGAWNAWVDPTAPTALPTLSNLNTAPDGLAIALSGATGNPLAAVVYVDTRSATISGSAWRTQRAAHENNGTTRTRSSWQGTWGPWSAASTA